jgi:hypothetical protein
MFERVGDDGAGDGRGCVPAWRIDVTTLMMVSAVCALTMLADLRHAAWLAVAAKATGSGIWTPSHETVMVTL